jgi:D-glycero-D-manno-heptose 1,7-bisphosphate phosphatase
VPRNLLLLDRDGTLMTDTGYPSDPATVTLVPGAAAAVRQLADAGFRPVVVSNQSGVGRGKVTGEQAFAVHRRFIDLFRDATGLTLPAYYCYHAPADGCGCRKPLPGLLRRAAVEWAGVPAVMVGDKPSDVAAGAAVGAATVWLGAGREYPPGEPPPDHTAAGWADFPTTAVLDRLTDGRAA